MTKTSKDRCLRHSNRGIHGRAPFSALPEPSVRAKHRVLFGIVTIYRCEPFSRNFKTVLRRRVYSCSRCCRSLLRCPGRVATAFLAVAATAQAPSHHSRELPGPKAGFFERANWRLYGRRNVYLAQHGPFPCGADPCGGNRFLQVPARPQNQLRVHPVITASPRRIGNRPSRRFFDSYSTL